MAQPRTLSQIDQEALAWFVANGAEASEAEGFKSWRDVDPRHGRAYTQIETLWSSPAFARAAKRTRPRAPRATTALTLALSAALISGATLKLTGMRMTWPADHATAVGKIAAVRLDDGSRVVLDTDSAIDVAMGSTRRDIRLLRGRAFITVAPDRRPLNVLSGDATIRDIGTRFSVSRGGDGEHVAVAEGVVELRAPGRGMRTLGAGQASAALRDTLTPVATINVAEGFGWTKRRYYFTSRRLDDVANELRRYHRGWIFIADDTAAALPISGGLNLDNPVAAMDELARLSGTRLTRVTDRILILH